MPQDYGTILKITVPELGDEANIVTALGNMYYGTGTLPSTASDLAARLSIGGYIQRLFLEKANYTDKLSVFATTSSSELKGIISDETGSGSLVFANTPTLATPTITSPTINTSIILPGSTSGNVTLTVPAAAGTSAISFPARSGIVITSGDTGTVTNTMLAGSIENAKLVNSTISGISLGNNLPTLTLGSYLTGTSYNGTSAVTVAVDAATANTASKVVARDGYGNFSAGTITATLSGNASSATKLATARKINGTDFDGTADVTITSALANALTIGGGLSLSSGTTFDGSAARTLSITTTGASDGRILKYTNSGGIVWADASEISGTISNAVNSTYATNLANSTLFAIPYQDTFTSPATSKTSFLSPNTLASKRFLTQTGTGSAGQAPAWSSIVWSDVSGLSGTTSTTFALGNHLHTGVYEPATTAFTGKTYEGLTLTAATTGFTIAGGTTSKTLTVSDMATVSGTNTGDQTTITGNAGSATKLATARNINGVSFDGTAAIIIKASTTNALGLTSGGNLALSSGPGTSWDGGTSGITIGLVTTPTGLTSINGVSLSGLSTGTFVTTTSTTSIAASTSGTAATATNIATTTKVSVQDSGTAGTPNRSAVGQVYVQATEPVNASAGDLWFW